MGLRRKEEIQLLLLLLQEQSCASLGADTTVLEARDVVLNPLEGRGPGRTRTRLSGCSGAGGFLKGASETDTINTMKVYCFDTILILYILTIF